MGLCKSKLAAQQPHVTAPSTCSLTCSPRTATAAPHDWSTPAPRACCATAAAAPDFLQQVEEADEQNPSVTSSPSSTSSCTSIQDLPPLLLAKILSQHLSWGELFGAAPLVCRSWYALAQHIAPEQLTFEFDLAEDGGRDDGCGGGAPARQRSLLQALLSAPQRLLLRATGQAPAPVPAAPQLQAAPGASLPPPGADAPSSQEHEFSLQNEPWAAWLRQRGGRLQDFAMTITNLDSNCAAAQCQLKETLLRALADSAPAAPGALASRSAKASSGHTDKLLLLSSGGSGTSSNSAGSDLLKTALYPASDCNSSDSGDSSSPSQPGSPLSTSTGGDGFESCASSLAGSAPATAAATAAATSTSHSTALSTLQLRSLHLKVPLFEYDVLLLANDICSKAPALRSLSLVGYSSSGAVTTRAGKASPDARGGSSPGGSGSASSGCLCRSNRPQLFAASSGRSFPATAAAAAAAAASSAGSSAAGNAAAPEGPAQLQQQPACRKMGMGRGGFITGSSLKQLVAAVPQLERLTFACRQLYKLSWLQPATQLTYLSLRDCSLGPNLLKELAGLKLPRLRSLDLSGSKGLGGAEAPDHLRLLARIGGGGLEQLDISGWELSAMPSRAMPQLAALTALTALKMECCGLKGWELEASALPRLTALSLSGNALDSHGIAAACAITQLQSLELRQVAPRELMLMQQVPAQAQGPLCWAGMRPMPQLTHLSLAGNAWPDSSLPERGPLLPYRCFKQDLRAALAGMPRLARLDLSECKVPYKALPLLLAALPASVTELVLDNVAEGLRSADLEAVADLPRLAVLSAAGCNIRDKHAAVLAQLHQLRRLGLRDNAGLGPDGVCVIVGSCDQLTMLDVGGGSGRVNSSCSASVRAAIAARGNLLLVTRD